MHFIYPARLHRTASDEIPRPSARRAGEHRVTMPLAMAAKAALVLAPDIERAGVR